MSYIALLQERATLRIKLDHINAQIKAHENRVLKVFEAGGNPTGFRYKKGRVIRKITDPDKLQNILHVIDPKLSIYEDKLKGFGTLERELQPYGFTKAGVADLIYEAVTYSVGEASVEFVGFNE